MTTMAQFSQSCEPALIDRSAVLDRVGGDEDLLREITSIFLDDYPNLIAEIEAAVDKKDGKLLERAAHSLKGSVSNFGAQAATQASWRLESMARKGNLDEAEAALQDLKEQFQLLRPALSDLIA